MTCLLLVLGRKPKAATSLETAAGSGAPRQGSDNAGFAAPFAALQGDKGEAESPGKVLKMKGGAKALASGPDQEELLREKSLGPWKLVSSAKAGLRLNCATIPSFLLTSPSCPSSGTWPWEHWAKKPVPGA